MRIPSALIEKLEHLKYRHPDAGRDPYRPWVPAPCSLPGRFRRHDREKLQRPYQTEFLIRHTAQFRGAVGFPRTVAAIPAERSPPARRDRRAGRVERFDRGDPVKHPTVVDEGGVERLGQRKAAERPPGKVVNRRLAALDVFAPDHQHQHPIDPVAVHPLRGRATGLARSRLDAELVQFDMPGLGPEAAGVMPIKQCVAGRMIAVNAGWRRWFRSPARTSARCRH